MLRMRGKAFATFLRFFRLGVGGKREGTSGPLRPSFKLHFLTRVFRMAAEAEEWAFTPRGGKV